MSLKYLSKNSLWQQLRRFTNSKSRRYRLKSWSLFGTFFVNEYHAESTLWKTGSVSNFVCTAGYFRRPYLYYGRGVLLNKDQGHTWSAQKRLSISKVHSLKLNAEPFVMELFDISPISQISKMSAFEIRRDIASPIEEIISPNWKKPNWHCFKIFSITL